MVIANKAYLEENIQGGLAMISICGKLFYSFKTETSALKRMKPRFQILK